MDWSLDLLQHYQRTSQETQRTDNASLERFEQSDRQSLHAVAQERGVKLLRSLGANPKTSMDMPCIPTQRKFLRQLTGNLRKLNPWRVPRWSAC